MAIIESLLKVNMDMSSPNCDYFKHIRQGSTNNTFEITLTNDGIEQELEGTEKVTAVVLYNVIESCEGDKYSGSFVYDPNYSGYNITIKSGKIILPLIEQFTTAKGKAKLILKIDNGSEIYPYSLLYTVDKNEGYSPISIPDNLPKYEDLKRIIDQLNTDNNKNKLNISQNSNDISKNSNGVSQNANDVSEIKKDVSQNLNDVSQIKKDVDNKADKDFSNIDGFAAAKDGSILYKKDGKLQNAKMIINDSEKIITTPYSFQSAPSTFWLGSNLALTQNGGFVEDYSKATGKYYLMLDMENDRETGTKRPVAYTRGAKKVKFPIQSIDNKVMNNVTMLDIGRSTEDHQTQAVYFKLINAVTNLKIKININGVDVMDYPYNSWNNQDESGFNLGTNIQKIDLKPFWTTLSEYNVRLYLKADTEINLLGNGTLPWYALDLNPISRESVAYLSDIGTPETPNTIVKKLESIATESEKLDSSAIKNMPSPLTTGEIVNNIEKLPEDKKLDYITGLKNKPTGTITGKEIVNKLHDLTDDEKLSYNDLKDKPSGTIDENNIKFIKAVGVEASNKTGSHIDSGTYVMIYPTEDRKFNMVKITQSMGYHGETFGYLRNLVQNGSVGFVELITVIQTKIKGSIPLGATSYIGFDNAITDDISIKEAGGIGACGVFGNANQSGEYLSSFNIFKVQSAYFGGSTNSPDTAVQIRNKLQSLTNDERLGIEDLKNVEATINSDYVKKKIDELTGDDRIDASAIKNIPTLDTSLLALKDLSNIDNSIFKTKSTTSGMLEQGLEDVNLDKLKEKGVASGLADDKLSNVTTLDLDNKVRQTQTMRIVYERLPQVKGIRAKIIETQNALTASQFNVPDPIIHIRYQITTQNEIIQQLMPSVAINKALIFEIFYSDGVTGGGVELTPIVGQYFNGGTTSFAINKQGMSGTAFSETTNWDWIPYTSMSEAGINVNDQKSNFYLGMESMSFGNGFTASQDPNDNTKVKIDYDSDDTELTFVDTENGNSFTATKLKSLDKTIRLSQLDATTADIAIIGSSDNVGVFARLNEDLLLNSEFSAHSKLHFIEDPETKNSYVYGTNKKGFVIQDVNPQDDPNVSGGSQFICIFNIVPSDTSGNIITQDGSIVLQLLDSNGNIIQDTQNKELGIQIDYKAGQKFEEQVLALIFTVKSYTEVFPNILMNFPNEEIISLSADTSITLQSFTNDFFKGLAIKAFEDYSGHHIDGYTRYYGYNSINMAQYLSYDTPVQDVKPTSFEYANRLYFSCKTEVRFGIQQGKMVVKDDGTNFPIFSIAKVYDELDCEYIGGKYEKISVKLENNNTAFNISLLQYTGNEVDPPRPELLSYNNATPVFTTGWASVQDFPINSNAEPGEHTYIEGFLLPNNAKQLAIILYPRSDSIPKELYLVDLEGDFSPWFNRFILTRLTTAREHARMYQKEHYLTLVSLPKGISGYRFTADNKDTKVPIGVVLGGDGKIINDNAWKDTGAYDPDKVQGDYKFLADGKIKDFSYIIPCYNEGVAQSEVHFWLAKVKADGTFDEIPNSRVNTTIPANRSKSPLMVTCPGELDDKNKPTGKFSFSVLKGESVRVFMKSDKTDGFYIECGNGMPFLYKSLMDFYEITETDKNVADLMTHADEITFVKDGVPVSEPEKYRMQIDVKTGQTEIKEV